MCGPDAYTLFDVLTALDAALFGGSRKPLQPCIGQFDDVASHRLDADVIAGDRGALPITLAVAAVAICVEIKIFKIRPTSSNPN